MKYIWKNSIRRMLPAGIGLFLLCLIFPRLTGYAPLDALRALYGGMPLGRLTVQAGFFLTFSLLQYCGWLGLSCLLKNKTNLLARWQDRGKLFAALWKFLLPTDLLFVLCAAAGTLAGLCGGVWRSPLAALRSGIPGWVSVRLYGSIWTNVLAGLRSNIPAGTLQELAEISIRGLIECIFLSGLQLFFLVRLGEERTAIAMTAIAAGMTLISLSPVRLVWLAPAKTPFPAVSLVTGVCLAAGTAVLGEKASQRDA